MQRESSGNRHGRVATPVGNPADRTSGRTLDHAAPVYDLLAPLMTLGVETRCSRDVLEELRLTGGEKVLDVGCGTGKLTREIAHRLDPQAGSLVIGLDAAMKMLEVARRKAGNVPNLRFEAAIAEELPYADRSFDRFVSTFFFHHVNAGLKRKTLKELWRVLRPGGIGVIVDVDVPYNLFGALCAWSGYVLFHQDEIRENIRGELRRAFDESPFAWQALRRRAGYITTFVLTKPDTGRGNPPSRKKKERK
jgi:ubiquinone/menaquinone biosynthesis C-methylase UbiE